PPPLLISALIWVWAILVCCSRVWWLVLLILGMERGLRSPLPSPFLVVIPCQAQPSSFWCGFVVVIDFLRIGFRWWWYL
ncbi:hypothetical protein GIB67_004845, partial [Kingdonia uniflora]